MEKVQFFHDRKFGKTFAIVPPPNDELVSHARGALFGGDPVIPFLVGIATLGKGDMYSKSIGRNLSQSRLAQLEFKVTNVEYSLVTETLSMVLESGSIVMQLRTKLETNHPYIFFVGDVNE